MNFINSTHPETQVITADLSWTGGRQNTGLVGAEKYIYTSNGWTVELNYPVIPHPIYTVSANYTKDQVTVSWEGTSENDIINETSYTSSGLTPVLSPQEQAREDVMAYIQANHTETDAYLPVTNWTGGRATPEGLVGYETYVYSGSGWNVTIGYVVYYDIIYNVNATYQQNGAALIEWRGTVHNGAVNETSYTSNLQLSTVEQARNQVMAYIQSNHPETAAVLPVSNWTGGHVDQGMLLGSETYSYTGGNWTITLQYPVVPNPIYTATANYTSASTNIAWAGTWQNGTVTETSYTPPENTTTRFTEDQIRDKIMNYIATNHPETAALMTNLTWVGQDTTKPGLVGYSTYQYNSTNWVMSLGHPVIPLQYYEITANYTSSSAAVQWSGLFQNGFDSSSGTTYNAQITESSYTYSPKTSSAPVMGGGNLLLTN
jgi:hypothetical protein